VAWILAGLGLAVAAGFAWGLFESQWVEKRVVDAPVEGLPAELEGFRIAVLSDFHLGPRSLAARALGKAVDWTVERSPDLILIAGDLLTRRRGEAALARAVGRLDAPHGVFAVLGNHDVGESRDPFIEADADHGEVERAGAALLVDESRSFSVGGARVQIVGVDPRRYQGRRAQPADLAEPEADLRILLCHFPEVVDRVPEGVFGLVVAGHMHGGQICLPWPGGRVRLEHLRARYWEGLHRRPGGTLYVSRGLGTSFVPFRFLARPEVAELRLTRA
jgi:predicted MPP superfamily phosphohydrolase